MRAHVGDRLVVSSPTIGGVVRDGEIVELRHADGSPPYVVRWSDSGHTGLYFPGIDAHLSGEATEPAQSSEAVAVPQSRTWRVDIDLFEAGDETTAHAVLLAEPPRSFAVNAEAHRNPKDLPSPEIGEEVAVARALRRLADRLLERASTEVISAEGPHTEIKA